MGGGHAGAEHFSFPAGAFFGEFVRVCVVYEERGAGEVFTTVLAEREEAEEGVLFEVVRCHFGREFQKV